MQRLSIRYFRKDLASLSPTTILSTVQKWRWAIFMRGRRTELDSWRSTSPRTRFAMSLYQLRETSTLMLRTNLKFTSGHPVEAPELALWWTSPRSASAYSLISTRIFFAPWLMSIECPPCHSPHPRSPQQWWQALVQLDQHRTCFHVPMASSSLTTSICTWPTATIAGSSCSSVEVSMPRQWPEAGRQARSPSIIQQTWHSMATTICSSLMAATIESWQMVYMVIGVLQLVPALGVEVQIDSELHNRWLLTISAISMSRSLECNEYKSFSSSKTHAVSVINVSLASGGRGVDRVLNYVLVLFAFTRADIPPSSDLWTGFFVESMKYNSIVLSIEYINRKSDNKEVPAYSGFFDAQLSSCRLSFFYFSQIYILRLGERMNSSAFSEVTFLLHREQRQTDFRVYTATREKTKESKQRGQEVERLNLPRVR